MNKFLLHIIFLLFTIYTNCNAQTEGSFQEMGFVSDANFKLIEEMTNSFENQICKHYNITPKNSSKAFYQYIQELKDSKIKVESLASEKTNHLLKKSIKNLLGYIWITNKDKRARWNLERSGVTEIKFTNPDSKIVQEYIQELKATENILSIDYQTDFTKNLTNKTYIDDLKDVISTLKDKYERGTPSLIALGLSYIKEEDFSDKNLKTFIAFELFYASLNTLQHE